MTDLVVVEELCAYFPARAPTGRRAVLHAVDKVSFAIRRNEILALVGESGCGKSTLGRTILQLQKPTAGRVLFDGQNLAALPPGELRRLRRRMQVIFQNPHGSLDPRISIGQAIRDPLDIHAVGTGDERRARVAELLGLVGLHPDHARRFPHQISGGQAQRVAIARALALHPEFIIADEPVSSLDVSIQAQILNLMADLRTSLGLTYLFIAHNLAVVEHFSTRVAVMYLGRIVELGPSAELYARPLHPYTQGLLASAPVADPDAPVRPLLLQGDVPSPLDPPPRCRFESRCPSAMDICRQVDPDLTQVEPEHWVACHLYPGQRAAPPAPETASLDPKSPHHQGTKTPRNDAGRTGG
ncbi:MAG TPA: oligopeptide/dipeptide ABC transporter ATP-binding protein [Candidatus Methylomirabilis sp.]|nr:oligopeptide/dipeptide ABC transporter ATP-binding protein [Candidatus Methylomirabilis sp.]